MNENAIDLARQELTKRKNHLLWELEQLEAAEKALGSISAKAKAPVAAAEKAAGLKKPRAKYRKRISIADFMQVVRDRVVVTANDFDRLGMRKGTANCKLASLANAGTLKRLSKGRYALSSTVINGREG